MTANFKVVVPNEIQVGCHKYSVFFDEAIDPDYCGRRLPAQLFILLNPSNLPTHNLVAFLHEILHATNDHYLNRKLEEPEIDSLSEGLSQALQSMGIEFDFSQIKHRTSPK